MNPSADSGKPEWRKPKFRRKGERDGAIDWKKVKRKIVSVCCLILLCGVMFVAGMIHEMMQSQENNHAWWKDYAASRIREH